MRIPVLLRGALVALTALFSVGLQSAHADIGGITLVVYKGGWFIGGSAGHGTLNFHGLSYPLDVGGIDLGSCSVDRGPCCGAASVTSGGRLMLPVSTAQPARVSRSALASAALYSSTRKVLFWNSRADRSG